MNKNKRLRRKRSLVTVLSLGFMLLGLGFISWSIGGIWTQTHYSNKASIPQKRPIAIKKIVKDANAKPGTSKRLPPANKPLYPVYPVGGDNIGSITIPTLNRKLTMLQGTEEKELKQGVGHFTQSVLPGEKDNCVISGHRETAFSQLNKLKIGNQLIVQTSAGTFTYEVIGTRIVHKDDKTVIVPTKNAVLTMTTCYPFNFIGNAPDRYIVSSVLVKKE
ncbi:MAG TPA: class D sortase [Clostridium sp.]